VPEARWAHSGTGQALDVDGRSGGSSAAGAGARTFDGLVGEVAVWGRALTDAEIADRHRQGRTRDVEAPEAADPQAIFAETFAAGEDALGRWEFTGNPQAKLSIRPARRATQANAAYVDFREPAAWSGP